MEKESFSDLNEMEKNDTLGMQRDIKRWLAADQKRTFEQFTQLCIEKGNISKGSIERIYYWNGEGDEPNWTRRVRDIILEVIDCEAYHFKKHKIK